MMQPILCVVSVPVHIFHHTPDLTTSSPSIVSISCSAVGHPTPNELLWISPRGIAIKRTSHSGQGKRTVTLTVNISVSDEDYVGGRFICKATTSQQSTSANTTLFGKTGKPLENRAHDVLIITLLQLAHISANQPAV